jgi:hypothetical protein
MKCTPKDSEINKRLTSMNFENYYGKEVNAFLEDLGYSYNKYVPYMKKAGYISTIIFCYSDSLTVDIRVSDLS